MSRVEIRPIELPKDTVPFVKSWWRIYQDDPHWVPPLIFERKEFFDPARNPYFNVADVKCFMAYKDGEALGTIAATVDHEYQKQDAGMGMFGFFEFVDDCDIAHCLLEAAKDWLRDQGMDRMMGPFNFNTNHEFGLLVDGFDTDPYIANPHNSAYYEGIYDQIGLRKNMDWYAYRFGRHSVSDRMLRLNERFLQRHPEVEIRPVDMANYDKEVEILLDIYNDAWEQNWGHVHITEDEFWAKAKAMKPLIDPRLCYVALIDGEPAGVSITLADYNQVAKKMNGRLFPMGWYHWVFGKNKIDRARIFILGVRRKYQRLPLGAPMYVRTWQSLLEMGMNEAEASLILENNHRMRGALEKMGAEIYKTYRTYECPVADVTVEPSKGEE